MTDLFEYQCMPRPTISDGLFCLMCVQHEHIESIRQWRNAQMAILRQNDEISPQGQLEYFKKYIWSTLNRSKPDNILLAFLQERKLIGYGGLVHIAWQDSRAEVSFLLESSQADTHPEYASRFRSFLALLSEIAFKDLKLNRLFTESYSNRSAHLRALENAGFLKEGILREHTQQKGIATDSVVHSRLAGEYFKS